jgi:GNAT superfamily N-acetyltransferase
MTDLDASPVHAHDPPAGLRPARAADADQLTDLALRSKAHWGYSAEFMAACRQELTVTAAYLDGHPTWVVEEPDGEPPAAGGAKIVGFFALAPLGEYEVELDLLYVDPAAIGRGLGSRLFAHARDLARERGFRVMEIQSDPNAEGFYRRVGAVTVGSKPSLSIPGRELPLMRLIL